jgi:hypothetical protein
MVKAKQQQCEEYYTTPPPYYATKSTYATSTYNTEALPPKCTPPMLKSYATNYAAPNYISKAPEYYITEVLQLRRRSTT